MGEDRHPASPGADKETSCYSWVVMGLPLSVVLSVGVTALYVLSVTEASLSLSVTLLVQLCMALFRIVSSFALVPWLAKQVPRAGGRIFFELGCCITLFCCSLPRVPQT